jgi:hypothetical protein
MFNGVSEVTMKFFADVFWNVTCADVSRESTAYSQSVIFYTTRSFNKCIHKL